MRLPTDREDADDLFSHTRMSFGDHIEELRLRMIRAILGFLVALVVGLFLGQPVLAFIQAPLQAELQRSYNERADKIRKKHEEEMKARGDVAPMTQASAKEYPVLIREGDTGEWKPMTMKIDVKVIGTDINDANAELNHLNSLTSLTITEPFMTYFMVSMYCGAVLAGPWILYQLWLFVGAGLYPHEKKYIYMYMPLSVFLFLAGVALCEFVVLPLGIRYLLGFNEWLGVEPELRLSEWLSFAVTVPLVFGCAFQTPLVMLFLERLGIVNVEVYTKHRKMAIFILAIAAAFLAAAPDALNMMMLAVPLWGLYEFGILLCRFAPKPAQEIEEPDPDEMVEV
jgi:sec-independent protein translocase protein TatC